MLNDECLESDHGVRSAFDVNRIDEANVFRVRRHHHRMRALSGAEKADAS